MDYSTRTQTRKKPEPSSRMKSGRWWMARKRKQPSLRDTSHRLRWRPGNLQQHLSKHVTVNGNDKVLCGVGSCGWPEGNRSYQRRRAQFQCSCGAPFCRLRFGGVAVKNEMIAFGMKQIMSLIKVHWFIAAQSKRSNHFFLMHHWNTIPICIVYSLISNNTFNWSSFTQ